MIEILDFYSPNCVPCNMLKRELETFENVRYIDVMEDFDEALKYDVRKAPTTIIFKDGEEVERFVGIKTREEIESLITHP